MYCCTRVLIVFMVFLLVSITPGYALQSDLQDFVDFNQDGSYSGLGNVEAVESVPYVGSEPDAVEVVPCVGPESESVEVNPGHGEILPGGLESDDGVKPSSVDLEGFHQDLSVGYAKRANNALLITTGIAVGLTVSIVTAGLASSAILALGGTYLAHMVVVAVVGAIGGLVSGIVMGVMKGCIEGDSTDAWEHAVNYGGTGMVTGFIMGMISGAITRFIKGPASAIEDPYALDIKDLDKKYVNDLLEFHLKTLRVLDNEEKVPKEFVDQIWSKLQSGEMIITSEGNVRYGHA